MLRLAREESKEGELGRLLQEEVFVGNEEIDMGCCVTSSYPLLSAE